MAEHEIEVIMWACKVCGKPVTTEAIGEDSHRWVHLPDSSDLSQEVDRG
ncbi:hypothetical protein [Microbacterium rhizomatis]|nr:hypothetical protein [Microbacterium rhizomatis]